MGERNALSVVRDEGGNELQWWAMAKEQAAMLVKTGFLPSSIKTTEQCLAIMLKGRELAIPAMYALSNIAVINGKPACGAELMLALVHRDHGRDAIRVKLTTNEKCTVEWKEWGALNEYTFTLQDAQKANLASKDTWKQYPAAMLRARAISAACRMAFPASIAGMYTPEELGAVVTVGDDGSVEIVNDPRHADYIASAKSASPEPTPIKADVEVARDPSPTPALPTQQRAALSGWNQFWPWAKEHHIKNEEDFTMLTGRGMKGLTPDSAREVMEASLEDMARSVQDQENGVVDGDFSDVPLFDANSPERFTH